MCGKKMNANKRREHMLNRCKEAQGNCDPVNDI